MMTTTKIDGLTITTPPMSATQQLLKRTNKRVAPPRKTDPPTTTAEAPNIGLLRKQRTTRIKSHDRDDPLIPTMGTQTAKLSFKKKYSR